MSKAHTAWAQPAVPSSVQVILDDPAAEVDSKSSTFWILVSALKRFVVRHSMNILRVCIQTGKLCSTYFSHGADFVVM